MRRFFWAASKPELDKPFLALLLTWETLPVGRGRRSRPLTQISQLPALPAPRPAPASQLLPPADPARSWRPLVHRSSAAVWLSPRACRGSVPADTAASARVGGAIFGETQIAGSWRQAKGNCRSRRLCVPADRGDQTARQGDTAAGVFTVVTAAPVPVGHGGASPGGSHRRSRWLEMQVLSPHV